MTQNQNQKHVVVSFKQDAEAVKMQLHFNGQQIFESIKPDVFVGALHCVGTDKLQFRFDQTSAPKVVQADYPLLLDSAFALVEETEGFETKTLMRLIHASLQLHDAHKLAIRDAAVAAWASAETDLPEELVVNRTADLPRRPKN